MTLIYAYAKRAVCGYRVYIPRLNPKFLFTSQTPKKSSLPALIIIIIIITIIIIFIFIIVTCSQRLLGPLAYFAFSRYI